MGESSLYRFHVTALSAGFQALAPDEAHHAQRVLRLAPGQVVEAFDGKGNLARATLAVQQQRLGVLVESVRHVAQPLVHLTLACAVPKADRAEYLVEMASQLDAAAVQWTLYDRAVVKPGEGGAKMEKWRRVALESAKQSGRSWVMQVHAPRPLGEVLSRTGGQGGMLLWCDPSAPRAALDLLQEPAAAATPERPLQVVAFIGPEGGFTDHEIAAVSSAANVQRVRLSQHVLRVETAAVAMAAVAACLSR